MTSENFFIVDSGGTKTEWAFIQNGVEYATYITKGLSPQVMNAEQMKKVLKEELAPKLDVNSSAPEAIYFYGTACSIASNAEIVKEALQSLFKNAYMDIQHDMLGAARSLCLNKKGIAAIIGTGASSAVYDGKWISKSRNGIGYVLGDEGGGAYMGKKLMNLYCYDELPPVMVADLEATFEINKDSILENVYKKETPNQYLASFARFISKHKQTPLMQKLILESLDAFFTRHLLKFEESKTMPLNFIGGISNIFSEELALICKKYNLQLGKIMRSPTKGLIDYHLHYNN